jgi:hypothetical protein
MDAPADVLAVFRVGFGYRLTYLDFAVGLVLAVFRVLGHLHFRLTQSAKRLR